MVVSISSERGAAFGCVYGDPYLDPLLAHPYTYYTPDLYRTYM